MMRIAFIVVTSMIYVTISKYGIQMGGGIGGMTKTFRTPSMSAMTVCAWVKLYHRKNDQNSLTTDSVHGIVSLVTDSNYFGYHHGFSMSLRSSQLIGVVVNLDDLTFIAPMSEIEFHNFYCQWHSICVSWDGRQSNTLAIFVDGIRKGSHLQNWVFQRMDSEISAGSPIFIGLIAVKSARGPIRLPGVNIPFSAAANRGYMGLTKSFFHGCIASVDIWNTSSSDADILERYLCNSTGTTYSMDVRNLDTIIEGGFESYVMHRCMDQTEKNISFIHGVKLGDESGDTFVMQTISLPLLDGVTACVNFVLSRSSSPGIELCVFSYVHLQTVMISLSFITPKRAGQPGSAKVILSGNVYQATIDYLRFVNLFDAMHSACLTWDNTFAGAYLYLNTEPVQFQIKTPNSNRKTTHHTVESGRLFLGAMGVGRPPPVTYYNTWFHGSILSLNIWNKVFNRSDILHRSSCGEVGNVYNMNIILENFLNEIKAAYTPGLSPHFVPRYTISTWESMMNKMLEEVPFVCSKIAADRRELAECLKRDALNSDNSLTTCLKGYTVSSVLTKEPCMIPEHTRLSRNQGISNGTESVPQTKYQLYVAISAVLCLSLTFTGIITAVILRKLKRKRQRCLHEHVYEQLDDYRIPNTDEQGV